MKKIYFTLLAIAAFGASQAVLADNCELEDQAKHNRLRSVCDVLYKINQGTKRGECYERIDSSGHDESSLRG